MINVSKISLLAVFVLLCWGGDAYAQKRPTWFDFFFPSMRERVVDPSESLEAPFAEDVRNVPEPVLVPLPEEKKKWDEPHRLPTQIGEWVMKVSVEALSFSAGDYKSDLEKTKSYFNANGRSQYLTFLEKTKILEVAKTGRFNVRAVADDAPALLNEGAVAGFYRWVFKVPIMISYLDADMKTYGREDITTQHVELVVQAVRSPTDVEEGVVIEIWDGKVLEVKRPDKK